MRKTVSYFAALAFIVCAVSAGFADFTPGTSVKKTAKVNFIGTGTFTWDVGIYNVSDDSPASEISWDVSSITPGTTKWATSTQYILISSTMTQSGAGIQVYMDNMNGTDFKYTGSTNTAVGGLVAKTAPTLTPLGMAWAMKDSKQATAPKIDPDDKSPGNEAVYYASCYFKDKSGQGAMVNGESFITILNTNGMKYGQGENDRGGSPNGQFYMYIGANFQNAMTPMEYGTDTITFEGYTE